MFLTDDELYVVVEAGTNMQKNSFLFIFILLLVVAATETDTMTWCK